MIPTITDDISLTPSKPLTLPHSNTSKNSLEYVFFIIILNYRIAAYKVHCHKHTLGADLNNDCGCTRMPLTSINLSIYTDLLQFIGSVGIWILRFIAAVCLSVRQVNVHVNHCLILLFEYRPT